MIIGYSRTSTIEQVAGIEARIRDLKAAGAEKLFRENVSSVAPHKQLEAAIEFSREGDTLVVTKIDRLARSVRHLCEIQAKSVSCKTIPCKMKQGINSRRTGRFSNRAGNGQRLAGNCPPCAGAREPKRKPPRSPAPTPLRQARKKRSIARPETPSSTTVKLTSQPKPSLMALQKMPIGQLWGGGRLVDLFRSSLSRLWMA